MQGKVRGDGWVWVIWGRSVAGLGPFELQTGRTSSPNDPARQGLDNLKLQPLSPAFGVDSFKTGISGPGRAPGGQGPETPDLN